MYWLLLLLSIPLLYLAVRLWYHTLYVEPYNIQKTTHDVLCTDLPPQLEGLRVCQVSDLHITAEPYNQEAISRALRTVEADLFVLTGDLMRRPRGQHAFFRWFDEIDTDRALRPCVAVLGNAEHKPFVRPEDVVEALTSRQVPVIVNSVYRFPFNGGYLQIVGVDDPHTENSDFDQAFAEADPSVWTLLLCHTPDGIVELRNHRADLILCGHTHGGQIRLPLLGAPIQGTWRVRGLAMGWYGREILSRKAGHSLCETQMYVSRGLGASGRRNRLLCPPEIAIFTLRGQANHE